jgi:hypothetical protein
MVAFAAVLSGWWSDRQWLEERIAQRDDLLLVLRAAQPEEWTGEGFGVSGFQLGSLLLLHFDNPEQFIASFRDGSEWKKPDGSFQHLRLSDELASAVIPRIVPFLRHADPDVRHRAAYTLREIAKPPSDIVPDLVAALSDECPKVREEAMGALRGVDAPIEGLGARLSVYLNGDEPEDLGILLAMIQTKDPAFDLTERMTSLLAHANPKTRAAAAEALQQATPAASIMGRLIRAFKSEDDAKVRRAIARTVEALHRK